MMKLGIFGGSFDPLHKGHVELAVAAQKAADLWKVVFVPAHLHPFGEKNYSASDRDRYGMIAWSMADYPWATVSTYEIDREEVSYTVDTLRHFREIRPDAEIYFIVGADAFLTIEKWKGAKELLENYSFIVGSRPGSGDTELDEFIERMRAEHGTQILKVENELVDISSTELREKLAEGEDLSEWIPERVEDYIFNNDLYRRD